MSTESKFYPLDALSGSSLLLKAGWHPTLLGPTSESRVRLQLHRDRGGHGSHTVHEPPQRDILVQLYRLIELLSAQYARRERAEVYCSAEWPIFHDEVDVLGIWGPPNTIIQPLYFSFEEVRAAVMSRSNELMLEVIDLFELISEPQ